LQPESSASSARRSRSSLGLRPSLAAGLSIRNTESGFRFVSVGRISISSRTAHLELDESKQPQKQKGAVLVFPGRSRNQLIGGMGGILYLNGV
jgi:hypothetical protein